jgi:hypothetical protein
VSFPDPAVIGFSLVVIALASLWVGALLDLFVHWQARGRRMLWLLTVLLVPLLGYILYYSYGRGRPIPARGVSFSDRRSTDGRNDIGVQ